MVAIKNKERLDLLENLLRNVKIVLMENVMTRDFNKKVLAENPQLQEKIIPLVITIESDIKQSASYLKFIEKVIEELKTKPADEIIIIFEDKKNDKETSSIKK
jgi:hypothetical protein